MPTTEPDSRLKVAVGVLRDRDGLLLMQQRIGEQVCAGQWEFPGGKIELGESSQQALRRELKEELNAKTSNEKLLMQLPFDYPHAKVQLEIFLVEQFSDDITGKEGQPIKWLTRKQINKLNVLAAVHPIIAKLQEDGLLE